jgi:MFS family permease
VLGDSATVSGLVLIGFTLGWVAAATLTGRAMTRTGRYRPYPIAGSICVVTGAALLTLLDTGTSHVVTMAFLTIAGVGMGLSVQAYVVGTQNAVAIPQLGTATAALQFFRSMGGSLAVAGLGALLSNRLASELSERLGAAAQRVDPNRLLQGGRVAPELSERTHDALATALQSVFLVTAVIAAIGVVLALALEERPLRSEHAAPEPSSEQPA